MRVGDPAPRGLRPSALTPEPVHSIRQRPGGQQPRHSLTSGEEKNSAKHRRPNPALVELGGISTDRCASCRSRCAPQRLRSAAACSPTPPAVAAVAGVASAQGDPAEGRGGRRDPRSTRGPTRVPLRRPRSAWLCARRPAGGARGPGCAPGLGVRRQLSETGTGGRGRLGIRSPGLLFLSWGPRASRFLPLCLSFLLGSAKCEMGPGSRTSARLGSALLRVGVQLLWESRLPWST